MTIRELRAILSLCGLTLTRASGPSAESIYLWVAGGPYRWAGVFMWFRRLTEGRDPRRIVYAGKASTPQRLRDELRWAAETDRRTTLSIGFPRLIRTTHAAPQSFCIGAFDTARALALLDGWEGPAIDDLSRFLRVSGGLTASQAEKLAIRVAVHSGRPFEGNAASAGMWESQLGHPVDTLAQLAVAAHATATTTSAVVAR